MAEIAIFCYSRSLAHAGRAVTLARFLAGDGHRVTLVGQPHYLESSLLVDRAEFALEVVHEPSLGEVLGSARGQGGAGGEAGMAFAGAVFEELAILERRRPDLVITDNRRSAIVSAEIAGIPSLSLTNASLLGPLCAIDPTIHELATICAPSFGRMPGEITSSPEFAGQDHATPVPTSAIRLAPGIVEFCAQFRIRQRQHVHELCLGDRTLVLDVESLYPVRDLPGSASVVGPLLFDVASALPAFWDRLHGDGDSDGDGDGHGARPIIYATFGSTGEASRFELAIDSLAHSGHQVVVTTADLVPALPAQGHVHACRYLPSSLMMARAALVVCHGGSLTMYQALSHGVPILAIPTHLEQAVETIPLVRAGVARVLDKNELHPDSSIVADQVASMLADVELTRRARALASTVDPLSALDGCRRAVTALLG